MSQDWPPLAPGEEILMTTGQPRFQWLIVALVVFLISALLHSAMNGQIGINAGAIGAAVGFALVQPLIGIKQVVITNQHLCLRWKSGKRLQLSYNEIDGFSAPWSGLRFRKNRTIVASISAICAIRRRPLR
ncbi:MAG: hypothetical protein N4A53_06980 [Pelagimonas sp.]|jgi:hypothetical protein|nr:hypothetical protein [Pelagimonas sp.]